MNLTMLTRTNDEKNKKVAISLSYFIYNYSFNLINASFNSKTEYKIKILSNKYKKVKIFVLNCRILLKAYSKKL